MISDEDFDNLRHMLGATDGAPIERWGYRNYFAASVDNVESMERLVAAGYALRGRPYFDAHIYHATDAGCRAIGFTKKQIANGLEES